MEEKIIISNLLRNFTIKCLDSRESITQVLTSIVVPKQAITIDFKARPKGKFASLLSTPNQNP
ncbi:hypothetical protein B4U80_09180 [Leptotrombidium deliense]|uniref:Uncharacterized protein n=1 Tax=Leptotrombidium deliense TaxID=299467 RepID=A0A443RW24_9ACAR|nr:hypothetical protein B4U80_09180 [Leptotrombidium deliense]